MFRCFQDGMVIQRESNVRIWGFSESRTPLDMEFCEKKYRTITEDNGEFVFEIRTGSAGGPYCMTISSGDDELIINDILIGDVYIISGQSNMELPIQRTIDLIGPRLDSINYPQIREFRVPEQISFKERKLQYEAGRWLRASDNDDLLMMSATGFNFAENIYLSESTPIGLINTAIGGTPIEAHLPEEVLAGYKVYDEEIRRLKDDNYINGIKEYDAKDLSEWYTELYEKDTGIIDGRAVYADEECDDSGWNVISVPGMFYGTELEDYHGSIWLRKEFYIPEDYDLSGVMLRLGAMVDADKTYLNGILCGSVDYCYPPRRYPVKDGILKHGRNVIAVQLIINRGTGGFVRGKKYCLQGREYIYEGSYMGQASNPEDAMPSRGRWELNLSGEWKYIKGASMRTLPLMTFFQYKPAAIYNGMEYPLSKYTFKGGIWYQAESNAGNPFNYKELMTDLIKCWRGMFSDNLPFLYVQLPQFDDPAALKMSDNWALIREEQRRVLDIDNTAMAATIDVGESNDLHPQNKEAVGKRLALAALSMIYGRDVEYSGPQITKAVSDKDKSVIRVNFLHCRGGLTAVNDNFDYFELGTVREGLEADDIYSDNIEWVRALGFKIISEDTMEISYNPDIRRIDALRYAWFNDPCKPPLYNGERLVAPPFSIWVS